MDNRPSASYFVKQLLELGGEVGLHGYNHQPLVLDGYVFDEKNGGYQYWETVEDMLVSVKAALAYGTSLSEDVVIQSYVAPSNVLGREAMDAMIRQFEDLRIFAGVYIGTPDQLIEEITVLKDDVVLLPRLTADMQMEDSEWWLQINELNYHYYESNYVAYGKHTPEAVVIACSVADFTRVQDMGCIQNGSECDPQWSDIEYTEYCSAHNPMTNRERLSSVPMLVFQGLQDTVVSPNVTRAFEHYVTSAADHNATFIYDENAAHEATPSFITRVIPFLKQFLR